MNVWRCASQMGRHVVILDTKIKRRGAWVDARVSQMLPPMEFMHQEAKRWALQNAIERIGFKLLQEMRK